MAADWALWSVFLIDYVVGMAIAHDRRAYAYRNGLTLAVVLLSFPLLPDVMAAFRGARLARAVRLVRLGLMVWRFGREMRSVFSHASLVSMAAITLAMVFLGAVLIDLMEPEIINGDLGAGIWWAAITATTVGYGDIAPKTGGGRLLAVFLVVAGSGLISVLSATLAAHFVGQREAGELAEIKTKLQVIEQQLDQIAAGVPPTGDVTDGREGERSEIPRPLPEHDSMAVPRR